MDITVYDALFSAVRLLFLFIVPLLLVVSLVGIFASSLQAITTIREEAVLYSVKLLAVVAVLYFTLPSFIDSLLELSRIVFSGERL